jgi:hypothetical protein
MIGREAAMDCDQVFMILTRGPFPTGALSDELVEEHLEVCGDCWRLAEALRPAHDMFQESVSSAEGRDLPGYWGDARPASAAVAALANNMTKVAATRRPRTAPPCAQPSQIVPGTRWGSDLLPAMTLASAVTAAILGVVMWLRS